jgi:hypothetical protein
MAIPLPCLHWTFSGNESSHWIFLRCLMVNTPHLNPHLNWLQSQSQLLYDWRFTANQFVLATGPLRSTTSNFILQLNTCGYSPYVTSSLTRGWVYHLQLLLSSPAHSYSGPSPARLMTSAYCLRFETPPTWRTRSLYLYPPGTGCPGYTPRHWVDWLQCRFSSR